MDNKEIKKRINELNEIIKSNFSTQFTLNKEVADAISEIKRIQENECKHKYKDGFCSICGREQI